MAQGRPASPLSETWSRCRGRAQGVLPCSLEACRSLASSSESVTDSRDRCGGDSAPTRLSTVRTWRRW